MAFPTPSTAPREQGVSLLFTPLSKAADGQKGGTPADFRSFSGLGRTPASAGRAFGGAGGAAGPTPPSRRRSLTPASSRQMDTPPPPPMDSLLDSPGGLGAGAAPWGQGADGVEDMQVSTSPYAAARAAAAAPAAAAGRDLARAAHALEQYEDTWVTVFGFGPSDLPLVIREFSKAGDIAQFGTFGESASVNWIHIQYQNKHAAQRALLHNGEQLSATCMVGVKPLDASHRAAVERQAGGANGGASFAMAFPKLQQQRPYTLEAASGAGAVVPLATKGLAQRVREFVLGC
ncbi:nuclear pore complex NUP35-like [Chlorella sorokiniana]|uniref:Nuclear pore complex NUP35-like n=1 Tax=Chlorella sorokiniana TaxID=3076 RepID=A0A2P6TBY1_CHLSO|nr:nuclear pore complex NUP35-like [Chlorella sorokiniana]|eukprot:PRW18392.1 nuclear pore complex NUP35-like [Chlorella sorokiniana]